MQHDFTKLLEATGIPFAVIANLGTAEIVSVGDRDAISANDLFNILFVDFECVLGLNRSLKDQLLPRIWSQGDAACVVCKPEKEVIVGLFCVNECDSVAQYYRGKKLGEEVAAFWEASRVGG